LIQIQRSPNFIFMRGNLQVSLSWTHRGDLRLTTVVQGMQLVMPMQFLTKLFGQRKSVSPLLHRFL
jgi:hypothetical protein